MPRLEQTFRTDALIIRRQDYLEADRLLTLMTPAHGKIRAIAKGVRKPAAKMGGHLELYTRANLLLRRGRDLHQVTQAECAEPYRAAREHLHWYAYASHLVELLDRFSEDDEPNPPLYALLNVALGWLAEPSSDLALITRFYETRLLRLTGFEPSLFRCAVGGEKITAQDQFFSVGDGGLVCPDHARGRSLIPLSLNALKLLRHMQTDDFEAVSRWDLSAAMHATLERVAHTYIAHILESRLKSADFLHLLQRLETSPSPPPVSP